MLIDLKVTNVIVFGTLNFSMLGVKSRKEQPDTVKNINGELLGKVSLIYGANGSGKSTFVRIMSVLRSIVLGDMDTVTAHKQLAKDKSLPIEFGINFIANGTKYSYLLKFSGQMILAETLYFRKVTFRGRHSRVFERLWDGEQYNWKFGKGFCGRFCKKAHLLRVNQFFYRNNSILYFVYRETQVTRVLLWFDGIAIVKRCDLVEITHNVFLADNVDSEYMEFLLKSLRFADINISALKFNYATGKAMAQIDEDTWIPITELSTGEQNYLALMMQVYRAKEVIIIDDFGQGLHPRLSKELLKLLHATLGKQVIATTHEVTLIESEIRPEQIWFVDSPNSKTEMVSLCAYFESPHRMKQYLACRYGGVPFISETEFWGYNANTNGDEQ